jgi:hypothetical protein
MEIKAIIDNITQFLEARKGQENCSIDLTQACDDLASLFFSLTI